MPKVQQNADLAIEVNKIVARLGSQASAAKHIGIDKTTLWRFLGTGRVIERNRKLLQQAVANEENETPLAANEMHPERSEANGRASRLPEDLQRIRAMCQSMMTMIDMYETWSKSAPTGMVPVSMEKN